MAGSSEGSFIDSRSWPKKRCFELSKRERAADSACPLRVLPSSGSVTPDAPSAASRLRWMIAYREEAIMRRNAA
jgi:hypothetical protein